MRAVAELPGFDFGGPSWMEALHYFESHQFACTSFLQACTTPETKLASICPLGLRKMIREQAGLILM